MLSPNANNETAMIVNTSFTHKSGALGSSMFSRSGRTTIHDHIVFWANIRNSFLKNHQIVCIVTLNLNVF